MDKPTLVAGISLVSLGVFLASFLMMLRKCDGMLRAPCVDQRLLAVAVVATVASLAGLVITIVVWRSLPTWLHLVGIATPFLIIGIWIKETIFSA